MGRRTISLDEAQHDYIVRANPPEHPEQTKLRQFTAAHPRAKMQLSPEQGHLLAFLIRLTGARRALEIGTFTGYSALAVALALPPDGTLVACDVSDEYTSLAKPYWERAGVAARIDLRIGPAIETLHALETEGARASFDMAFIDADKPGYDSYYEAVLRLLRPGGLVALDNMLIGGSVADPDNNDPRTAAVRTLNAKIAADERVDRVLLPVGDGMTLARKR